MREKRYLMKTERREKGYISLYERLVPPLVYMCLYMTWFNLLEDAHRTDYVVMHTKLDDLIPFAEIFVIPYMLWFPYVIAAVAFLILQRRAEDYYKALLFLCTGMTLFLAFSTFVPTLQPLRPLTMPRDNVLTRIIEALYRTDTPTNVFPSIHVYNSVGCMIALSKTQALKDHPVVRAGAAALSISIILSTMFIKQHSVIDVIGGLVMAYFIYRVVYQSDLVVHLFRIREREYSLAQRENAA